MHRLALRRGIVFNSATVASRLARPSIAPWQRSFSDIPSQILRKRRWRPYVASTVGIGLSAWALSYFSFSDESKIAGVNTREFSPYILVDKVPVSSTSSLFVLAPAEKTNHALSETLHIEALWNTELKQPDLQIARVYTPIPLSEEEKSKYGPNAMRFWIREEEQGEVSRWVHRLPLGSKINFRGPNTQYAYPPDIDEILFLAGGTGLTPALQMAHGLLDRMSSRENLPRVHIMWANRHREDCVGGSGDTQPTSSCFRWWPQNREPANMSERQRGTSLLVEELEQLKVMYDGKLRVDYFIDDEKSFITWNILKTALSSPKAVNAAGNMRLDQKRMIFVSGPDGFVAHLAGPKQWLEGREVQGELSGLLKDVEKLGWNVWKL